ncbi:MAG: glycosyltransferase family 2 protein [Planctomycetes bacterium]|nr:glycosyltransferase family 2 protein [Planctomycetota bacterium]
MADPALAALLLNYRHAELTRQCLHDLLQIRGVALHVLVIDNGSDDGSATALQVDVAAAVAGGHRVSLLALPDNLGFTGAMNRGIAWATQQGLPFVAVLNNDLRLPPDSLRPLVDALIADPAIGAVGPTILFPDGRVWAEGGELGFAPNGLRLCGHGRAPRPATTGPVAVGFLTGACLLARTAELVAIGGFDDAYFMYWEDVDLCRRLGARGRRIVWLPWVSITHAGGQSSGGGRSPLRKFLMANNSVRYLRAAGSVRQWVAFVLLDLLAWPLLLLSPAGPRAAWAKACGLLAGLRGHRASAADVARWL